MLILEKLVNLVTMVTISAQFLKHLKANKCDLKNEIVSQNLIYYYLISDQQSDRQKKIILNKQI